MADGVKVTLVQLLMYVDAPLCAQVELDDENVPVAGSAENDTDPAGGDEPVAPVS